MFKFELKPNCIRVWSKEDLVKHGYPSPHHDNYLIFLINKQVVEGDFATMDFDGDKLKDLLNRYGKNKVNFDRGAVAVPFSELISCKRT